jgi:hypothetical protein
MFEEILGQLTRPPVGRSRRISSNQQPNWNDGNVDMTLFQPGEAFELPVLKGPGLINHIWMTSHSGGFGELDSLSLRIYWDGRAEPGVEVPLGLFFGVGQGRPCVVESVPVQVSPTGSLTCYWRMPFAESARIVVTNDNPDRSTGLYWQVDWVELPELPPQTAYFHARYRQEYPAVMGRDYLIADLAGQGQFVGTTMAITMAQDGWFGEGDDFFYIDGEAVPSLQGTGSEDYFNDAWGFRPRNSAWFGQPRWEGWSAGDSGVCYRWHVLDPVGFTRSLQVTMEHKGNRPLGEDAWYLERPDYFASIAYWYQTGEPKPWEPLPGWPERAVPWQKHHLVRALRSAKVSDGSPLILQSTGFFGGRPTLLWKEMQPGARLTFPFTVGSEGRHALRLVTFAAPDHGVFDIEIDGEPALRNLSFAAAEEEEKNLLLGERRLAPGEHTLAFRAVASPGESRPLVLEQLHVLALPEEARREVRREDCEARFIRIGIGRAVYAYRLAYGELPTDLQTLVDMGLMEAHFLKDENGVPLRVWREPEHLCVEATGPNRWTHRWTGLDARR